MAVGDIKVADGTAVTWTSSGGDYAISFNSIADTNGRTGAKHDFGASRDTEYAMEVQIKTGTTPTDGTTVDVYWVESGNATAATDNAGQAGIFTGSDATVTAPTSSELAGVTFLGSIVVDATSDTIYRKKDIKFTPTRQYGFPLLVNNTAVTTNATGTDHSVTVTPLTYNSVQA